MSKGAFPAEEVSERAGQLITLKLIIGSREYLEIVVDALNNESSGTGRTRSRRVYLDGLDQAVPKAFFRPGANLREVRQAILEAIFPLLELKLE